MLEIHRQQIERYGGASGVRDLALLESAIPQPQASLSNEFLRASIAAITFLLMNDWEPIFTDDALVDAVLAVASSSMTKEDLARFFQACSVPRSDTHG